MMKSKANFITKIIIIVFYFFIGSAFGQLPDYKYPKLSIEKRIADLISRMTVEEKVYQLATKYPNANIRLGIPSIVTMECLHGVDLDSATSFPQAIGLASTWDPELVERITTIIAKECRALGIHQCYSPMLAVVQEARWGRTEESYGEDPYLVSRIGVAYINGLQGRGKNRFDKNHIMATAKHFVADGAPIAGNNGAAMDISERNLHEIHLRPFKAAIEEAHVGSIMAAHHSLNGIPCHANKHILVDILRKSYGFDGLVISDNKDIRFMYEVLHVAESMQEAARLALEAQVDQELEINLTWYDGRAYGPTLLEAVQKGIIPLEYVDRAVSSVLRAKFHLGLFDDDIPVNPRYDPVVHPEILQMAPKDLVPHVKRRKDYKKVVNCQEHASLALEAAQKAIILLKNEGNLLPLDKSRLGQIAVIGPNANEVRLGGYASEPLYFVTVLEGIKKYVGNEVKVVYEKGCDLYNDSIEHIDEAVGAARESDVSIVVVGGSKWTSKENIDRDDLNLVGAQRQLIKSVTGTGKPVIVVLLHGQQLSITWTAENVPAILDGWYLGQETGTAVAQAIFGAINPGGKLPVTVPRNVGQCPYYYYKLPSARKWNLYQSSSEPLFPFGFGLSYTTFEFGDPEVSSTEMSTGDSVTVSVNVKNTGNRSGDEVVQLYIHDEFASVVRPEKELKGFKRISIKAGQTQKVSFKIRSEELEFWKDGKWIVEPGDFRIMLGPNSVELKSTKLKVNN